MKVKFVRRADDSGVGSEGERSPQALPGHGLTVFRDHDGVDWEKDC